MLLAVTAAGHTGFFPIACSVLLALVVLLALSIGPWPALFGAAMSALALNWGFTEPLHSLAITSAGDIALLACFCVLSVLVSVLLRRIVARAVADTERRLGHGASSLEIGDWHLDLARKKVAKRGEEIPLTPTEWSFLELLARNPGRLVTKEEVLASVWGAGYRKETNYLRVYIGQLRQKLEDDPAHPRHLITTHGVGYTLEP